MNGTRIKSPINYTGNKYRLLEQFSKFFPSKCDVFVDLFCGGATIGFNINADKIIMIDNNPRIIKLLETLAGGEIKLIIKEIEKNIKKYNLSYSYKHTYSYYRNLGYVSGNNGLKKFNEKGFYLLRQDYNNLKNKNTFKANIMLYILMAYAFNNDIRFNSAGQFNLPVGKTDFNKNNYNKLIAFNSRAKEINYEFICSDFRSEAVKKIVYNADFVYCDPPYLMTNAFYNENNGWSKNDEKELLDLLKEMDKNKISFALSNVIKKEGKVNKLLSEWLVETKFKKNNIIYNYRSSSYNKKNRDSNEEEVLITNEK